jgi:hypothetical protein
MIPAPSIGTQIPWGCAGIKGPAAGNPGEIRVRYNFLRGPAILIIIAAGRISTADKL